MRKASVVEFGGGGLKVYESFWGGLGEFLEGV